jgi:hypothetical protein
VTIKLLFLQLYIVPKMFYSFGLNLYSLTVKFYYFHRQVYIERKREREKERKREREKERKREREKERKRERERRDDIIFQSKKNNFLFNFQKI